jgi:hypothetical protein
MVATVDPLVQAQIDFIDAQIGGQAGITDFPNSFPLHSSADGKIFEVYNLNENDIENLQLYASSQYNESQINFKLIGISMSLKDPNTGVYKAFNFVVPGLLEQAVAMFDKNLSIGRKTSSAMTGSVSFSPFAPINGTVSLANLSDNLTNSGSFIATTSSTYGWVKTFDVTFTKE